MLGISFLRRLGGFFVMFVGNMSASHSMFSHSLRFYKDRWSVRVTVCKTTAWFPILHLLAFQVQNAVAFSMTCTFPWSPHHVCLNEFTALCLVMARTNLLCCWLFTPLNSTLWRLKICDNIERIWFWTDCLKTKLSQLSWFFFFFLINQNARFCLRFWNVSTQLLIHSMCSSV